jgi:hypothetical protein
MKWNWKPKWMRLPENKINGVSNGSRVAEASKREAQRKLRDAVADRKEVQDVIKESKRLSDKFGEAVEEAMRRPASG